MSKEKVRIRDYDLFYLLFNRLDFKETNTRAEDVEFVLGPDDHHTLLVLDVNKSKLVSKLLKEPLPKKGWRDEMENDWK